MALFLWGDRPACPSGACIGYGRLPEGVESWLTDLEEETCGSLRWIGCHGMIARIGMTGVEEGLATPADREDREDREGRPSPLYLRRLIPERSAGVSIA